MTKINSCWTIISTISIKSRKPPIAFSPRCSHRWLHWWLAGCTGFALASSRPRRPKASASTEGRRSWTSPGPGRAGAPWERRLVSATGDVNHGDVVQVIFAPPLNKTGYVSGMSSKNIFLRERDTQRIIRQSSYAWQSWAFLVLRPSLAIFLLAFHLFHWLSVWTTFFGFLF